MNTLSEIADFLKSHDNYIIIPHKNPDGDALGSSSALLIALRKIGKKAKISLPSAVTKRHSFMWSEDFEQGDFECDTAIGTDTAAPNMMGDLYDSFFSVANHTMCIDHHNTNSCFADINYVDGSAAAVGEIIFELIKLLNVEIDAVIAEKLMVSIADDTGGFEYSNTTYRTHSIASELYKSGVDSANIMRRLFGTNTISSVKLLAHISSGMKYFLDNKVCIASIDSETVEDCGAEFSEVDAWVSLPRSIEGVEVGIVLKAYNDSEIKASLRSNEYVDVSALAAKFGGGGHVRAAGASFFDMNIEEVQNKLIKELEKMV